MPVPDSTPLLLPSQVIKDTYVVDRLIGAGAFGEVYRVKHRYLGTQALKVLRPGELDEDRVRDLISEAKSLIALTHPNIVRVFEANNFESNGVDLYYLALEYVSGETLSQLLRRKVRISVSLALSLQRDICAGLGAAHSHVPPIVHRDIKPQNILLCYDTASPQAKVSDFGLAKAIDPATRMTDAAGTLAYMPPEGFWGYYTPASDVFSCGIVLYQMVTGILPWSYDFSTVASRDANTAEAAVLQARKQRPQPPSTINELCDQDLDHIVMRCMDDDPTKRYPDASALLNGLLDYENRGNREKHLSHRSSIHVESVKLPQYQGFTGVAGMEEVKELLYSELILPLQQRELYEKYRIPLPNGILLFGPPGCGKTFIAAKLAEEIQHTFMLVKPSDLASIYVHGGQEKIGNLFQQAREKAPSILVFDEIDAIIPRRGDGAGHHYEAEVNEFLIQLNESSRDNVVVIGTTNRPDAIDTAALRTGRFDKLVFVPPPDAAARASLFELYLSGRPLSPNIDYDTLSRLTDNYIASDMKAICDDAARHALRSKSVIDMTIIKKVLERFPASLCHEDLQQYERYRSLKRG